MVKYLIFCAFVAASYVVYSTFPVNHGPGIMADEKPTIERLTWEEPFTFKGATFTPQRKINGEVRVLKRKRYFFDTFSKYSPVDAMVGWNQLSDSRNLDYIYYNLGDRTYRLDLTRPPLPMNTIYEESDLWHFIPSSEEINQKLKALRDGEIVHVKGLLVDISNESDFTFKTNTELSTAKKKKGFIIWVEELKIK